MKPAYENPQHNIQIFKEVFKSAGLDWSVIGGIAAIAARAKKRETVDVDFVVSELKYLEVRLRSTTNPNKFRILTERDGTAYLIQGETSDGMHFDIYIAGTDFERAVLETSDTDHIASPEAIIVYKLMAMRPQDVDDIRSILLAHPNMKGLDKKFLDYWIESCGVTREWKTIVSSSK